MDTHGLTTTIRDLLAVLERDHSFLSTPLAGLSDHLAGAIGSYLGLQVLIPQLGHPFALTAFVASGEVHAVGTSVVIPLSVLSDREAEGDITFYASRPGAFVDLAADLSFVLGLGGHVITLDDAPDPVSTSSGIAGLEQISTINRAVGVLITRGHHPILPPRSCAATPSATRSRCTKRPPRCWRQRRRVARVATHRRQARDLLIQQS